MRTLALTSKLAKKPKALREINGLADQLLFYPDAKVIAFVSATEGDGAEVIAWEYARLLTEQGKNVLWIDTDMRRPARSGAVPGLSEYLSDRVERGDILCATNHPRLYTIPSGTMPPNPTDLLSGQAFGSLLSGARATFDYVILSTAALGSYIDGALVSVRCDGAVLCVSSRKTREKDALNAKRLIKKADCRILGVVLNKTAATELDTVNTDPAPKAPAPKAESRVAVPEDDDEDDDL